MSRKRKGPTEPALEEPGDTHKVTRRRKNKDEAVGTFNDSDLSPFSLSLNELENSLNTTSGISPSTRSIITDRVNAFRSLQEELLSLTGQVTLHDLGEKMLISEKEKPDYELAVEYKGKYILKSTLSSLFDLRPGFELQPDPVSVVVCGTGGSNPPIKPPKVLKTKKKIKSYSDGPEANSMVTEPARLSQKSQKELEPKLVRVFVGIPKITGTRDNIKWVQFSATTYIRLQVLEERVGDDYIKFYEKDNAGANSPEATLSFEVLDYTGDKAVVDLPSWGPWTKGHQKRSTRQDVTKTELWKIWFNHWKGVVVRARSVIDKKWIGMGFRFWDMKKKQTEPDPRLVLRFEASRHVSVELLKEKLPDALALCKCRPQPFTADGLPQVVEYGRGGDNNFKLLGHHYLGLYSVYAPQDTHDHLVDLEQHPVQRPYPSLLQVQQAATLLGQGGDLESGPPEAVETETAISAYKTMNASKPIPGAKHKRGIDQKTVMNNKSATQIAEIFWPDAKNEDNTWTGQAEWLHRSAFSFGGLGAGANPVSSQCIDNLIFGTKEANTFMIRPEDTIKNVVKSQHKAFAGMMKFHRTGITTAVFVTADKVERKALRPERILGHVKTNFSFRTLEEGDKPMGGPLSLDPTTEIRTESAKVVTLYNGIPVPPETTTFGESYKHMEAANLPFLTARLEYRFELNPRLLNEVKNVAISVPTFARVRPLRLEYELDKLIEEHVFAPRNYEVDPFTKLCHEKKLVKKHLSAGEREELLGKRAAEWPM